MFHGKFVVRVWKKRYSILFYVGQLYSEYTKSVLTFITNQSTCQLYKPNQIYHNNQAQHISYHAGSFECIKISDSK